MFNISFFCYDDALHTALPSGVHFFSFFSYSCRRSHLMFLFACRFSVSDRGVALCCEGLALVALVALVDHSLMSIFLHWSLVKDLYLYIFDFLVPQLASAAIA